MQALNLDLKRAKSHLSSLSERAELCLMRIDCLEYAVDYGLMQNKKKTVENTEKRRLQAEEELRKTLSLIKSA